MIVEKRCRILHNYALGLYGNKLRIISSSQFIDLLEYLALHKQPEVEYIPYHPFFCPVVPLRKQVAIHIQLK